MILERLSSGPLDTNIYILGCSHTKQACVIDAPQGCVDWVEKTLNKHQLTLSKILLTHSHLDHIVDAAPLKKKFNVPVLIHNLDVENLKTPGSDKIALFLSVEGMEADGFFEDGDVITVGDLQIQVILTPGHSPGGVCFYLPKEQLVFSGDTLFKNSMGRVDFPNSDPSSMWKSLKRLALLPPQTKVYPGHGPSTTIGDEEWMERAEERWN
jgi:hydroxyacylglutathione hydrolase